MDNLTNVFLVWYKSCDNDYDRLFNVCSTMQIAQDYIDNNFDVKGFGITRNQMWIEERTLNVE